MTSFVVGVRLDGNSAGLAKAAAEAKKIIDSLSTSGTSGAQSTARAQAQAAAAMRRDYQAMAQARETLGVRSERRIQQEIRATELAYQRLSQSGTLSWREQTRAADAMRTKVRELKNEMGQLTLGQKLGNVGRGLGMGVAGIAAGTALVAPKVQRAMSFDEQLRHMANTAYGRPDLGTDQDLAGRRAGIAELDRMIKDAVRYGGGSLDGAASTLNTILASGAFKPDQAKDVFREAVKSATANNAEAKDFALLGITANKTLGVSTDRMSQLFGMATYGGLMGRFEVADMAKALPSQMAGANEIGMNGEAGFAKLVALNQAAMNTAGTADEAGNNVRNLMAKLGSADTRNQFKKMGIDLPKQLAEGRVRGLDALDVVGGLLDQQLNKDKNYQAVQKQLAAAGNDDERKSALEAVANIARGTVVSKAFADQQALLALLGYLQDVKGTNEIAKGAMQHGAGAVDRNMELVRDGSAFSAQQAANAAAIANQDAMSKLTPAIQAVTDQFVKLAQSNPAAAAAVSGVATIGTGVATAAGTMALGRLIFGGGGGGFLSKAGGLGSAVGAIPGMVPALGVLGAGAAGYGVGTLVSKGIEGTAAGDAVGEFVARTLALFGNKEAAQAVAVNEAIKNSKVGGEITVKVQTSDPNVPVQHQVRPMDGTKLTVHSDVGRTHPEGNW